MSPSERCRKQAAAWRKLAAVASGNPPHVFVTAESLVRLALLLEELADLVEPKQ